MRRNLYLLDGKKKGGVQETKAMDISNAFKAYDNI